MRRMRAGGAVILITLSGLSYTSTPSAAVDPAILRAPLHDFNVMHPGGEDIVIPTEQAVSGACVSVGLPAGSAMVLMSRALLDGLASAAVDEDAKPGDPSFMPQHHKRRAIALLATMAPSVGPDAHGCNPATLDHDTVYLVSALLDRGQAVVLHPRSQHPLPFIVEQLRVDRFGGRIAYHFPPSADDKRAFLALIEWTY